MSERRMTEEDVDETERDDEHCVDLIERKKAHEDFMAAVNDIAKATSIFKQSIGEAEEDTPVPTTEEIPYAPRVPASVICLRLAHDLWRDTRFIVKHAPKCHVHSAADTMAEVLSEIPLPQAAFMIARQLDTAQRTALIKALQRLSKEEANQE